MKYPELTAAALITDMMAAFAATISRPSSQDAATSSPAASMSAPTTSETSASTAASAPAGAATTEMYAAGTGVPDTLPEGELGKLVQLGEELVRDTARHPITAQYVGNTLTCSSCHLDGGKAAQSGSFVGLAAAYPAFSRREGGVINLADRIANCYMRSMNGKRPPPGDLATTAITAYITWLSQGAPMMMNAEKPLGPNKVPQVPFTEQEAVAQASVEGGKTVYVAQCAACHGAQGQGQGQFPPVWGDNSYNDGAGMHMIVKSASWIKVSMPPGNPGLSDQQAIDVAAYINSQPRPHFVLEDHLLPGQDAPSGSMVP